MQEQGISLDEVDQDGNSAVHVASQHGYLGCIQVHGPRFLEKGGPQVVKQKVGI